MDGAPGAGTPELEVRLLGPIEVERDDEPVALGGQKPRTLFAALALEPGRVVSVDRLVEALWPGEPPDTAGHAIQVYVSQLRKALGPVIATRAPGYVLELEPERVDAHRFARLAQEGRAALEGGEPESAEVALREALALWRGPALADFLYEPFAQTQIARLEELRTVVVEERIEADLALGRHVELVSELEALVQSERLRERPRAQLMLALYRSGRQADALAAYRDTRATLVEELGLEPGEELKALERRILALDPARRGRTELPGSLTSFVGRRRELEQVQALVRRPGVRLLTLTGAGGTGKTRLALEAARAVAGEFADGARFVALAAVADPELVPQAIAEALALQTSRGQ